MRRYLAIGVGMCGALMVGAVVLIVGAAFALTRPVVDASERFLTCIAEGKTAQAYAAMGEKFRTRMSEAEFASAVRELALAEYTSATWSHREIEDGVGTAEGAVVRKDGSTRPIRIRLIYEDAAWKVAAVHYGGEDLAASAAPSGDRIEELISKSLLDLNRAVKAKDFTDFHDTLSETWKKQSTPSSLKTSFREFIEKNVDIGAIERHKPRVEATQPATADGVLKLKGRYPTKPAPVDFGLEYANERGAWKLQRISVHVGGDR